MCVRACACKRLCTCERSCTCQSAHPFCVRSGRLNACALATTFRICADAVLLINFLLSEFRTLRQARSSPIQKEFVSGNNLELNSSHYLPLWWYRWEIWLSIYWLVQLRKLRSKGSAKWSPRMAPIAKCNPKRCHRGRLQTSFLN